MNKCAECQGVVSKKGVYICDNCFDKRMKENIEADKVIDRKVESPHSTWF